MRAFGQRFAGLSYGRRYELPPLIGIRDALISNPVLGLHRSPRTATQGLVGGGEIPSATSDHVKTWRESRADR